MSMPGQFEDAKRVDDALGALAVAWFTCLGATLEPSITQAQADIARPSPEAVVLDSVAEVVPTSSQGEP